MHHCGLFVAFYRVLNFVDYLKDWRNLWIIDWLMGLDVLYHDGALVYMLVRCIIEGCWWLIAG